MPFKTALRLSLRRVGVPLLVWFVLTQVFDQWIMEQTSSALMDDSGQQFSIWAYASLSVLSSLLGPVVATILVLSSWASTDSTLGFLKTHLTFLIREQLRVLGQVLLWGLVFILPGVLRFFELSLVPWVVCFDASYNRGQTDALRESRRLFYRVWFRLLALLVVFWMLIPLLLTGLDSYRSYFETPWTAFPLTLLDIFIFLVFQWFVSKIWEKAHDPQPAAQLSVDRN